MPKNNEVKTKENKNDILCHKRKTDLRSVITEREILN